MSQIETYTLTRWNPIGPSMTAPAPVLSTTTFFSFHFHSCTEIFGALTKKYFFILSFFKSLSRVVSVTYRMERLVAFAYLFAGQSHIFIHIKKQSKITLLEHSALVDVHNVTGKHDRFYEREREKVTKQTKNKNIQHHGLCGQNRMSPAYGIMTERD
jgi:hypothetical protein